MTISSETRKAGPFNGNGVTTSFPFVFKTFTKSDVKVIFTDADEIETILVLDSDYTVTLNADQNANPGGSISYSTLATGEKLTVLGAVEYTQETDIQNQGGFYPEVIENALDKLTMQTQQIKEEVDRAVKVNVSSENNPDELIGFIAQSVADSSASASESLNSANQAEASSLLAEKWADENEDVPVVPGKFSAKHWAAKAEASGGDKLPISGGSLTGLLNLNDGADIASASTVDLTAANGNTVRITGTTAITAFTMNAGQQMELIAVGALPLTYNATTMNINGGASYTCTAGDRLSVTKDNAGVVRVNVTKQDGTSMAPSQFATQAEYLLGTDTTKALNSAILRGNNLVRGVVINTTSGTSHDFTGIPSWAKRITVMFNGVSTNGSSNPLIQLGDSGGIENTGYAASAVAPITGAATVGANYTSGFGIASNSAAAIISGIMTVVNITANEWVSSHSTGFSTTNASSLGGGNKTLSATLDRVRITTVNGTDTFDAGSINIMWE